MVALGCDHSVAVTGLISFFIFLLYYVLAHLACAEHWQSMTWYIFWSAVISLTLHSCKFFLPATGSNQFVLMLETKKLWKININAVLLGTLQFGRLFSDSPPTVRDTHFEQRLTTQKLYSLSNVYWSVKCIWK